MSTYEEWRAMEWDSSIEDFDSWFAKWWAEGANHWEHIPHRHNDDIFLSKWAHGHTPGPAHVVAKPDKQHRMSHDEQRDLGYDDQRDWLNDGPGDYGWSWDDEDPQPVQD